MTRRAAATLALTVACAFLMLVPASSTPSPADLQVDEDDMMISDYDDGTDGRKRKERKSKGGKAGNAKQPKGGKAEKKDKKKQKDKDKKLKPAKAKKKKKKSNATPLVVESEAGLIEARSQHRRLFLMIWSEIDPSSRMAQPQFRLLTKQWGSPGNVTLAMAEVSNVETTAEKLGLKYTGSLDGMPLYGLFLNGLEDPIRYQGGWSATSLRSFLHYQLALQPAFLDTPKELTKFMAKRARMDNGYGVTAISFCRATEMAKFEGAARKAGAYVAIATGSSSLAIELGAPFPSIVIASKDLDVPWALLTGGDKGLTEQHIINFLFTRGLPPRVVPLGYTYQDRYAMQFFSDRSKIGDSRLQVVLFHRFKKLPKTEINEESAAALRTFREIAPEFAGRALFGSHDFFDNDPTGVEEKYEIKQDELPTVVVLGNNGEKWHLQGLFKRRAVENLVERALVESKRPREPPEDWETLPRPTLVTHDEL